MILNKRLAKNLFQECLKVHMKYQKANYYNRLLIGNRDWVGFGKTGCASYEDDVTVPFPAIRFKENNNELIALREKEKGDWRKLTIEEKKILYRASFRQTFAEVDAPTGEWKSYIGLTLVMISLGLWLGILQSIFDPRVLPKTFSEEFRRANLRALLDFKKGCINGPSSKWDYEKDDWKK